MQDEATIPAAEIDQLQLAWKVARADPEDVDSWEKLASLINETKGPEAAVEALRDALALLTKDASRSKLYRRMSMLSQTTPMRLRLARLLEDDDRSEDAESSYRSVLRAEPSRTEALDGLQRIYAGRDALDRYDAILTRALKGVAEPAGRRALLLRRAQLRTERLDRAEEALADLEQLLLADDGDVEALSLKEEILEASSRHDELVKAYKHHLPYSMTAAERVDLLTAIAILCESHLGDQEQAISHYRQALEEDPNHLSALDSLIKLLERRRDWLGAIEILNSATESISDRALVSQLHHRKGCILEEQLLRPEEAEQAYRKASEGDAPVIAAIDALRSMARRRGDWVEVIKLGKKRVRVENDPIEKAVTLVELAKVWRDRLDNEGTALSCFEQALDEDPDNVEAAQVVAGIKLADRQHEQAHLILERLAERGSAEGLDDEELAAVQLKLAQTAEALERPNEAQKAFEKALELNPADLSVLKQYGYFLSRRGAWERAVELYSRLLAEHSQSMNPDELADMRFLLAQAYEKLSQAENAAGEYGRALADNPRHLPALRASIELARQLGRVRQCVDLLVRLRSLSPTPANQLKLSVQIADLLADRLHKPSEAAGAYREALELEPNNVELLEKLRKVLVRADEFEQAVDILQRLAHLAETERQRARFLRIAGDIQRERLDDERAALASYVKALASAPLDKHAHAAAVKILTRLRDWPRLAQLYAELLRRLPPPIAGLDDRRLPILTELVELYRYRLDDKRKAIGACESLYGIDPSHIKVREDLARLYEAEGMFDQAIEMHRSLISDSPFSIDSYHALRRIYEARGQADRTLCIAATLSFLEEADEDEAAFLRANRHALPIPKGRRLNESLYNQELLHPAAGGLLGEMFSFAAEVARAIFVAPHKEYKLKPRDQLNLRRDGSKVAEVFSNALRFLDLPAPEIYGKGVMVKGILAVNTSPIAVLFSEEAVRRASIPELRFMVARAMAFTRPENLLAASLSAKQLRTLLEAMVELAYPGGPIHPVVEEVTGLARKLKRKIPARSQERLLQLASKYREQSEELSIRDWLEGVEHTCNRAGLAFSGDLEAAVQVLKAARVVSPSGSHRSLIRELIFYTISENYFTLRQALKASI